MFCHGNRKVTKTNPMLVLRALLNQLVSNSLVDTHLSGLVNWTSNISSSMLGHLTYACHSSVLLQSMICTVTGNNRVFLMASMSLGIRD